MTDILDNANVISQRDPGGALQVISKQYEQATVDVPVQSADHDGRAITSVVISGMGGSALAALMAKVLLSQKVSIPLEVTRTYELPQYVGNDTLVVACSYSGNTEETLASLQHAQDKGAQVAILSSGGKLVELAKSEGMAHVVLPSGMQPRIATICNLRGLFALLENFGVIGGEWLAELEQLSGWLEEESSRWTADIPSENNYAKQIALRSVGKTPVVYGSPLTAPLAYKWKISWNENAKNVAFWNEYPEFNHNEFMGWDSHPVEKPFAVFDIRSSLDSPRIQQRFELSNRLLSGKRPDAIQIELRGESVMAQLVWGAILADFATTYTAILNQVDPTPVVLIERLKQELAAEPAS